MAAPTVIVAGGCVPPVGGGVPDAPRPARVVDVICLRQIAFVPNAGRPMAAPTRQCRYFNLPLNVNLYLWLYRYLYLNLNLCLSLNLNLNLCLSLNLNLNLFLFLILVPPTGKIKTVGAARKDDKRPEPEIGSGLLMAF